MTVRLSALMIGCAVAVGCSSPEARRTRGGGPGADVRNRPEHVRMHEGSNQYWRTPERIPAEHPPLEPARNAQQRSSS